MSFKKMFFNCRVFVISNVLKKVLGCLVYIMNKNSLCIYIYFILINVIFFLFLSLFINKIGRCLVRGIVVSIVVCFNENSLRIELIKFWLKSFIFFILFIIIIVLLFVVICG